MCWTGDHSSVMGVVHAGMLSQIRTCHQERKVVHLATCAGCQRHIRTAIAPRFAREASCVCAVTELAQALLLLMKASFESMWMCNMP